MCGIIGVIHMDGSSVGGHLLEAMAAALRHRGPDVQRTALLSAGAGLGHTRLKVIDLSSAADQPMQCFGRSLWIVYNGEIYNFRELRAELESLGCRFRTQSDTEVILHAYAVWAEACVERLDGMFAFGLVDLDNQKVLLARDRTGKKPLFYYWNEGQLIFASEIKALLKHPSVRGVVNEKALPFYLAYGYVPAPDTMYQSIHSLPPATRLFVDLSLGALRTEKYWHLPVAGAAQAISTGEAAARVRSTLTRAVKKRLIADVPIGAFLSGGVDSSIVVGLMQQLRGSGVKTFSMGFRGDSRYDETRYARLVARHFKTQHTEFIVEPKAFELLEQLVYYHDQPFGDASAIPTFLLCALARSQVTVALNGDGGDEVFGGYRRFQAAVWSSQLPEWLFKLAESGIGLLPSHVQSHPVVAEALRFSSVARRPWAERLARWISYTPEPLNLLRPELRSQLASLDWLMPVKRQLASVSAASPLTQAMVFNFHEYLPGDLQVKMDRCSMAHALETRSPFLDTAVVELGFQLPDPLKVRGVKTKVILKDAFSDLLPPAIMGRGKWGFGVPLDAWFRGELREPLHDLLFSPTTQLSRYLDLAVVRSLYDEHSSGARQRGLALWNLLTLEMWLRTMRDQPQGQSVPGGVCENRSSKMPLCAGGKHEIRVG